MLIQCPACHAQAKLPDSKEGAKVRCGECGRVYIATPAGRRGGSRHASSQNTGLYIGIGAAVVGLLFVVIMSNMTGGDDEPVVNAQIEEPEEEVEVIDRVGWDSAPVQAAVSIHRAAYGLRRDEVMIKVDPARAWAIAQAAVTPEDQTPPTHDEYALLSGEERQTFLFELSSAMIEGEQKDLVADWEPIDGEVIEETDTEAIVRLSVVSREGTGEQRYVEWRLVRAGSRWKAFAWERWLSPAEQKAALKASRRNRGYEKVTLSDGSKVLEREPEPLPHLDDTPAELRAAIDKAFATMIDLNLTKESSAASRELVKIGRPAIPILLTGLFEIPLDTEEQSIQVNMVVVALRKITGQYFGYEPQELVGSGTGTSKERRESAIKQWFAWWHRNERKFTEKEVVDGLEGKIKLTDREKRLLERDN